MWHHIAKAWKSISSSISFLSPTIMDETLQLNKWWPTKYYELEFGITMDKVFVMYKIGLRHKEIWIYIDHKDFLPWGKKSGLILTE